MLSCSRISLALLNIIILIVSIFHVLMSTFWAVDSRSRPCLHADVSSIQWMGIFMVIMTTIGILGSCFKLKALQDLYLWVLLILTIAITVSSCFIFALLPKESPAIIFQKTSNDGYWLSGFTPALQTALVNEKDWHVVKTCLMEKQICKVKRRVGDDFFDYIQTGCCKPPIRCGLEQKNVSYWEPPPTGLASRDEECLMWTRHLGIECFDCDSCKAGYLSIYEDDWNENIFTEVARMVILIAASVLAYYAFRDENDSCDDDDIKHRKHVNRV
ncbi:hypothetical protein CDL12_15390 [Handroanthus impetiginosus]|uniref:Tetraspanin family integral membrane protein n=1 Tax=Handroanthus impetiginosus TaxID=429701 RepID=A0A2G9H3C3_9LAMI|nr:hypothetical protein CDL12_15390 [Handroanthus impetiginosus]